MKDQEYMDMDMDMMKMTSVNQGERHACERGSAKDLKATCHLVEARHASTSGSRYDQVEMAGFRFGPQN